MKWIMWRYYEWISCMHVTPPFVSLLSLTSHNNDNNCKKKKLMVVWVLSTSRSSVQEKEDENKLSSLYFFFSHIYNVFPWAFYTLLFLDVHLSTFSSFHGARDCKTRGFRSDCSLEEKINLFFYGAIWT